MSYVTKDSGKRQTWETGAQRDIQEGKGRYDLLHPWVIKRDAGLYERGAAKYDAWNWTKGIPSSRYLDSLLRHVFQYSAGDRTEDHLAAIRFNAGGLVFNEEAVQRDLLPSEILDIPVWDSQSEAPMAKKIDEEAMAAFTPPRPGWKFISGCGCDACRLARAAMEDFKPGGTSSEEDGQ